MFTWSARSDLSRPAACAVQLAGRFSKPPNQGPVKSIGLVRQSADKASPTRAAGESPTSRDSIYMYSGNLPRNQTQTRKGAKLYREILKILLRNHWENTAHRPHRQVRPPLACAPPSRVRRPWGVCPCAFVLLTLGVRPPRPPAYSEPATPERTARLCHRRPAPPAVTTSRHLHELLAELQISVPSAVVGQLHHPWHGLARAGPSFATTRAS